MATLAEFNKVFVIESLGAKDRPTGTRLMNEIKPTLDQMGLGYCFWQAQDRAAFFAALDSIWSTCATTNPRIYPILHIDAHGAKDRSGILLSPSGEVVRWDEFADRCRRINVECHNNLVVTTGLCFGLLSIKPVTIRETTPFLAVMGPEEEVFEHEVDCMASFYSELLRSGDVDAAMKRFSDMSGSTRFGVFLSERVFLLAFAKYLRASYAGKGRQNRIERLLTQYRATRGFTNAVTLGSARRIIKSAVRTTPATFENMKARFLLSDHPLNTGRFTSTFADALRIAGL